MTSQIARILLLAALAFAVPAEGREKRAYGSGSASPGSYASSSSSGGSFGGAGGIACAFIGQAGSLESGATGAGYNSNGEASLSSGAYPASSGYGSGASALPVGSGYGGGTASSGAYPYNGAVTSDGAFAASSAGSYSGASGSNAAPSLSGGRFPSNSPTPNSGGGSYAGGYQGNPTAGPGAYGPQKTQGFPFNLPQGCFSGFPSFGSDPYQIHQQILNQIQRLQEENLRLSSQFAGASPQNGIASAFASGNIGPQGGYGSAGVSPPDPGSLFVRFGDTAPGSVPIGSIAGNIPPPTGSVYGISTSSQSGSTTINGQTKSYKTSEVTVNDNGKITTYKAHNP